MTAPGNQGCEGASDRVRHALRHLDREVALDELAVDLRRDHRDDDRREQAFAAHQAVGDAEAVIGLERWRDEQERADRDDARRRSVGVIGFREAVRDAEGRRQ